MIVRCVSYASFIDTIALLLSHERFFLLLLEPFALMKLSPLEVDRYLYGEVENTFVNIVNGQEMTAKVTTHTPPKPEEPGKPNPQPSLPNTGSAASMLPVVGMILGLLSLAGLRKYKK